MEKGKTLMIKLIGRMEERMTERIKKRKSVLTDA